MLNPDEAAALERKIAIAESERDAWKGKSVEHFRMAALLVGALRKQLRELREAGDTPGG